MYRGRKRRILGMTGSQWLFVGFLLLILCGIMVGMYWWLSSMVTQANTMPQVDAPNHTPPPQFTYTPLPTATLELTATVTPITYESLIPADWKLFHLETDSNVDVWLPGTYIPQTKDDRKKAVQIPGTLEQDPSIISIMQLKDTSFSSYMLLTTFEMWVQPADGIDLDVEIDTRFGALLRSGRLMERGDFIFTVRDYDARRFVIDINAGGMNTGLAIYLVRVGKDIYTLAFATGFNELENRLPTFDAAVQTFHISPIIPTATPTLTPAPPTNTALP